MLTGHSKTMIALELPPSPKRVSASQCASAFCCPPLGGGKSHTDSYVCVFACVCMCVWNYVCAFGTYVRKCGKVATIRWPTCVLVIMYMGFHSILFFEALVAHRLLFPPPSRLFPFAESAVCFVCVCVGGWLDEWIEALLPGRRKRGVNSFSLNFLLERLPPSVVHVGSR